MAVTYNNTRRREKQSTDRANAPTVAPSTDHDDGSWDEFDIYLGEIFINTADGAIWTRDDDGVFEIARMSKMPVTPPDAAGSSAWTTATGYVIGDERYINVGSRYEHFRCNTAHTSSADFETDIANWDKITVANAGEIYEWTADTLYMENSIVKDGSNIYYANTTFIEGSTITGANFTQLNTSGITTSITMNEITAANPTIGSGYAGELLLLNNSANAILLDLDSSLSSGWFCYVVPKEPGNEAHQINVDLVSGTDNLFIFGEQVTTPPYLYDLNDRAFMIFKVNATDFHIVTFDHYVKRLEFKFLNGLGDGSVVGIYQMYMDDTVTVLGWEASPTIDIATLDYQADGGGWSALAPAVKFNRGEWVDIRTIIQAPSTYGTVNIKTLKNHTP